MEWLKTREPMNMRLLLLSLLCVLSAYPLKGQEMTPFVKGGLTIGLFDGTAASDEDVGHVGLNVGAGVRIPINKSKKLFLEPALVFISKGNVYDVSQAGGKVTFSLWYLEAQFDFIYRCSVGKHWYIPLGTGLYGAYAIGSKVSTTNDITWFNGIPVGETSSMFSSEIGAPRWDAGWRVWTIGVEQSHFMFRWDFELGFFSQFPDKPCGLEKGKEYNGYNWAMSLNLGYSF